MPPTDLTLELTQKLRILSLRAEHKVKLLALGIEETDEAKSELACRVASMGCNRGSIAIRSRRDVISTH